MYLMTKKTIGITMGDPAGIGAEIIVKALTHRSIRPLANFTIFGDTKLLKAQGLQSYRNVTIVDPITHPNKWKLGKPSTLTGEASLNYLNHAIAAIKNQTIDGLVTAPLSKKTVCLSYKHFQGHTEYLQEAFKSKQIGMLFCVKEIKTLIITRHLPLKDVAAQIKRKKVFEAIVLTHQYLKKYFKLKNPKLGISGLNPHAGEEGEIGGEEITQIIPAIKEAKKKKISIQGPFAADTLFTPHQLNRFDAIITMYHDQGLTPIKALYFHKLVNLTIGLPFIRTSPSHGTAFDIAGQNKADPTSLMEAIRLTAKLSS